MIIKDSLFHTKYWNLLFAPTVKASYLTCGMLNVLLTSFNECASKVCLKGLELSWLRTYWNKILLTLKRTIRFLYTFMMLSRLQSVFTYAAGRNANLREQNKVGHQHERSLIAA